jgi:hypothetical protein
MPLALPRRPITTRRLPNMARLLNMHAPASCFTRPTARNRIATQTKESYATVTPLVRVASFHTAAVVHSAPPVLYLQLMAAQRHRPGRALRARSILC